MIAFKTLYFYLYFFIFLHDNKQYISVMVSNKHLSNRITSSNLENRMNSVQASNFAQLLTLYPLLKAEQHDRITIIISGKQFVVQDRQVSIFFSMNFAIKYRYSYCTFDY